MSIIEWPRSVCWAAAAIAIGSATPSLAQDQAPAATAAPAADISPAHLAAARDAISAIKATDDFDNILLNAATQIKSELILNNPDKQTEISNMVDDRALALAPRRGALENEVARVYASMFSQDELTDIAAFYNSEAGKKLLAQGPAATREMLAAAEVWGNGIIRDLRQAAIGGMNEIYATTDTAPQADAGSPAAGSGEAGGEAPAAPTTPAQ